MLDYSHADSFSFLCVKGHWRDCFVLLMIRMLA
jgi:hypothetical protein